jgi:hypothetical protein
VESISAGSGTPGGAVIGCENFYLIIRLEGIDRFPSVVAEAPFRSRMPISTLRLDQSLALVGRYLPN